MKKVFNLAMVVGIIIVLVSVLGMVSDKELEKDYLIPGVTCSSNNECAQYYTECIVHFEPGYEWVNDISCVAERCYCLSK